MVVAVLSVALVRHGICQGAEVCPCVVHARELSPAPIQFKLSGTAGSRNSYIKKIAVLPYVLL